MIYLGFDNGLKGGLVCLNEKGEVVYQTIMPIIVSDKNEYDIKSIINVFDIIKSLDKDIKVCLEKSYVRPIQGIRAAFSTGYGYGIMQALLEVNKMSYEIVNPVMWMKLVFAGSYNKEEKKQSVLWAQRKWPEIDWKEKINSKFPSDGKTDAAGIAYYCYLKERGVK